MNTLFASKATPESNRVIIHSDGSCLGNPGPGGWAAKLSYGDSIRLVSGGFSRTTNNRMELFAAISGLETLTRPCKVELYTDSRYVRDGVEKGWLISWQKRGWKKADNKPVMNKDLWQRLQTQLQRHAVRLHWVRGHAGHGENEEVDELARKSASLPDLPEDPGFLE